MNTVMGIARQVNDTYNLVTDNLITYNLITGNNRESQEIVLWMIATRRGQTPQWVFDQLKLCKLPRKIQELIDNESISYANAIILAHVPTAYINMFILDAMILSNYFFTKKVQEEVRKLRKRG